MTQYVDSSALSKWYIDEPETPTTRRWLRDDPDWVTANHTYTEVYRAITIRSPDSELADLLDALDSDWNRTTIVALDDSLCHRAAQLAAMTDTRTLDALHLAAAELAGGASLTFLTFDSRQARAARSLGWTVLGS